jgi:MoaA/NifB/PqqE/SkfB family radical SAM enzyme
MSLADCRPPWIVLAVDGAPSSGLVKEIRSCFEYLKIRNFPLIDIHFSFENRHARTWAVQTESPFCGPEEFHIDLSNRCTHSCVFCALYSPAVTADLKASGRLNKQLRDFMGAQLEEGKALDLIHSLPLGTRIVQFGGAGDPMLHPRVLDLITRLRERAITVEVLSNMEYLKEPDLERLTTLGGGKFAHLGGTNLPALLFTVNLSAASPETYVRTRPRQTAETFRKVLENLRRLSGLRARNGGHGAHFRLMCVLNRLNYHEASRYVELAAEIGALDVWFKPLEIHHPSHYGLEIPEKEWPRFRREMMKALERAERLAMPVLDRRTLLSTLRRRTAERDEAER